MAQMTIHSAADHGYSIAGTLPGDSNKPIERFQGFIIRRDERHGYYWTESEDYFASIKECRADIADWNAAAIDDDINPHEDSPSLDDSFHRHEVDVS